MRIAIVRDADALVTNVVEADGVRGVKVEDGHTAREAPGDCGPGWTWSGGTSYAEPAKLPRVVPDSERIDALEARIDALEALR